MLERFGDVEIPLNSDKRIATATTKARMQK